jgi:hypothetical protein
MPEDYSLVNNQVGFIKRHLLLESSTHPDPFRSCAVPADDGMFAPPAINLKREAAWPL